MVLGACWECGAWGVCVPALLGPGTAKKGLCLTSDDWASLQPPQLGAVS